MVSSKAQTVAAYLDQLPVERRQVVSKVLAVIRKNLPTGYSETMAFGMPSYVVTSTKDAPKPLLYAALAAQKNGYSVYLMGVYGSNEVRAWFEKEFEKSGKPLDMGKSCLRFKTLDDVPLPLLGRAIAKVSARRFLEIMR